MSTHLDSSFIIVIDRAGHNVGGGVGLRDALMVMRLLGGVLLHVVDGGEGGAGGAEHGEVAGVGVGVKGGRGVEEGIAGGEEGGGPQLCAPPQLVNVILKLLQLLKVRGLKGGGVKEGGAGGSWKQKKHDDEMKTSTQAARSEVSIKTG